jgi:hypothetical protein
MGAVPVAVIGLILASFFEIPSREKKPTEENLDRILQDWRRPVPLSSKSS